MFLFSLVVKVTGSNVQTVPKQGIPNKDNPTIYLIEDDVNRSQHLTCSMDSSVSLQICSIICSSWVCHKFLFLTQICYLLWENNLNLWIHIKLSSLKMSRRLKNIEERKEKKEQQQIGSDSLCMFSSYSINHCLLKMLPYMKLIAAVMRKRDSLMRRDVDCRWCHHVRFGMASSLLK